MALAPPATEPERIAWRQSLGAGLLLGLALGCAWMAHWAPLLRARLALVALALVLTVLGLGLMFSLAEKRSTHGGWRRWHTQFAAGAPFFSVLTILALAAIVTGNNLLYLIVSGLLAMVVVSGLVSALNLSGMELRFRLPEDLYAGRPVPVGFTLTNAKGFWPAYSLTVAATSRPLATAPAAAALEVAMPPIYFFYLPRRDHVGAESVIQFPGRGRYSSAAFVLATRFPFGLMRKWRRFQSDGREPELLVYPAPVAPTQAALAQLRAGARVPRHRRGEGPELYRVRPHQLGDSARQVHWKASARAGALRVREFSDASGSRLRLRLALRPELPPERAEAALSLCAGWLLALLDPAAGPAQNEDLWLEFLGENGVHTQPHHGFWLPLAPAHLQRRAILNYLAVVDPARWAPPPAALDPGLAELTITGGEAQLGPVVMSVSNRSADAGRSG